MPTKHAIQSGALLLQGQSSAAGESDEGEVSSQALYGSDKLTKGYQGILVRIALQLRWQYY
jgi:hypothetical protein